MKYLNISLIYIFNHLLERILDFFRHWYLDGFLKATHWSLNILERFDRVFALRITVKNWLQPLYQDYTIIGYLWGFLFRTVRIFSGLIIYAIFVLLSSATFLVWASIPIYVIYQIFSNL